MITDINQLDFSKRYTYSDYLTWKFKERVELIKGFLFRMSPVPSLNHQRIVGEIHGHLWSYLRNKSCQVFVAPFDVVLPVMKSENKEHTVLQPDIVVVCDASNLTTQGCNGVPDMVVEVLSPGNTEKEMQDKFEVYQEAGVQEYWIVDTLDSFLIIYSLNTEGKYSGSRPYTKDMIAKSNAIEGFSIDMGEVF